MAKAILYVAAGVLLILLAIPVGLFSVNAAAGGAWYDDMLEQINVADSLVRFVSGFVAIGLLAGGIAIINDFRGV